MLIPGVRNKQVIFSMAIARAQECSPDHLGNRKIEIRQRHRGRRQTEKCENGKKYNGHVKKGTPDDDLTVARAYNTPPPRGRYSLK